MVDTSGNTTKRRKKTVKTSIAEPDRESGSLAVEWLEYHRNAIALVPSAEDVSPGVAMMTLSVDGKSHHRLCTCSQWTSRTCRHLLQLTATYSAHQHELGFPDLDAPFRSSLWYEIASVLAEGCRDTPHTVEVKRVPRDPAIYVYDMRGKPICAYLTTGSDSVRFCERCCQALETGSAFSRSDILNQLSRLTLTETERVVMARGLQTRRQAMEQSFWYRMAYHGFRELGDQYTMHTEVDSQDHFRLTVLDARQVPVFSTFIASEKVQRIIGLLGKNSDRHHGLVLDAAPAMIVFRLHRTDTGDLDIRRVIQTTAPDGSMLFLDSDDKSLVKFGALRYHRASKRLIRLDESTCAGIDGLPETISPQQIPDYLQRLVSGLDRGTLLADETTENLRVINRVDCIQITPEALERDWCWLSVTYGMGNAQLSLADIWKARQKGQRFIETPQGWVDAQAIDAPDPPGTDGQDPDQTGDTPVKLSRLALMRLQAASPAPVTVSGSGAEAADVKRLFDLQPAEALSPPPMASGLYPYQQIGLQWLWFLWQNKFGGLLCDDMGLGKTHQVLALMAAIEAEATAAGAFLVVCPTTVINHWEEKIRVYAPNLVPMRYHGVQRDLAPRGVVITSYGILRRDIDKLAAIPFALAVFDEIQQVKNPATQAYDAATAVRAGIKLGLTGTPIENRITEIKALMDLTVPGYMGSDDWFYHRYVLPLEKNEAGFRHQELRRLISPFTLRRLKTAVLSDLPEKIEDLRTCSLSEDQVKLYRDAVENRGRRLLEDIEAGDRPVPYLHVFALLTLLKQICDHPAVVQKDPATYSSYQSGKWDLFCELVQESLDSGQKVVVYSQFLDMIRIMDLFFSQLKVPAAVLTGASRDRGRIVSRFNTDPDCRVFVGSLLAGGMGIDLVAGSVVIHYDRWWNAAREDQATDRVHRIGQRRGVQVFKLMTTGTLEEKIAAIIDSKRRLMQDIVAEDDPGLLKTFTREQLIDLLAMPGT